MARLDVSQFHWETYTLGTSSLRWLTTPKRKIKNFPFFGDVPHPLDFSNGKVRPSCYFGKSRTSVYEWRHHNKNSKTFLPWLQAPIKILSGKTEQSDDPIFVSRMRNAEACITENHHELARGENQKKASEKGAKWGFLGCFSLYLLLRDNFDFENVVVALVG